MTISETTTSFGYWVRRRRRALDLTQADLARAVSCATVTITKIERDERRPSRQMATLLADRLAIPAGERARFLAVALGEVVVDRLTLDNQPLMTAAAGSGRLPTNLPTPATPFVGRWTELRQLAAALADPACRLLTLLGAGGFGKTRLAIRLGELVHAQAEQFPDGVYFVALEGLEGGEFVIPAAAAALAFTFYEHDDQKRQLLRYLAPKRLLLILDNAEGILDPDLVLQILVQTPSVKILVTSREALNLQQEWLYPIGGMDVGKVGDRVGDEGDDNQQPHEPDAVLLFRQCAVRVQPTFDLERELVHVQHICRLVDGAPLAIELAATWLKAMPCAQIARELARSIDLLATSMRDVPMRHRSMRAVLERSWGHLAEDEQRIFRQMAIFEGGFRLEAAQAVVDAELWVLATLIAKSMVQLGQDSRYHIHTLLRQLGAERLAAQPTEMMKCQDRHATYFTSYLAERLDTLVGPGQMVALQEIEDEMDNIRLAWSYTAGQGRLLRLCEAQPALFRFLWMRGRYAEGEQMAYQALMGSEAAAFTDKEQAVRIALMAGAAQFAAAGGSYGRALAKAKLALLEAQRYAPSEEAYCYYVVGIVQTYRQESEEAIANLRAAYDLYRVQGNPLGTADAALQLGFLRAWNGDYNNAIALVEESLTAYRMLGNSFDMADGLNQAALLSWWAGDIEQAEELYNESRATALAVGNGLVLLQAIGGLAIVALAREQWDLAIELQHERLVRAQHLGHDNQVMHSLRLTVGIYVYAERYGDAIALLEEHSEIRSDSFVAQALVGAGKFAAAFPVLRQITTEKIAGYDDYPFTPVLLVAWAMLLESDCELFIVHDSAPTRLMKPNERSALAVEVLSAVQSYSAVDVPTRAQASRLLARVYGDTVKLPHRTEFSLVRPIQELASEMLALRLG